MYLFTNTYQATAKDTPVIACPHDLGPARPLATDDALAGRCTR
jgi:hypothetical protein